MNRARFSSSANSCCSSAARRCLPLTVCTTATACRRLARLDMAVPPMDRSEVADDGRDLHFQGGRVERLDDVVVHAPLLGGHDVLGLALRGHHYEPGRP